MSGAKHTPGPWVVRTDFKCGNGETGIGIAARDLGPGSGAVAWPCGTTDEQLIANARLIAASPALLEALQGLIREHDAVFAGREDGAQDSYYNAHPGRAIAYRNARAAIAKATGTTA